MKNLIWLSKNLLRVAALWVLAWAIFTYFHVAYVEASVFWRSPGTWLMAKIDRIPDSGLRYRISEHFPGIYRLNWICELVDGSRAVMALRPGARVQTGNKEIGIRCGGQVIGVLSANTSVEFSRNSIGEVRIILIKGLMHFNYVEGSPFEILSGAWKIQPSGEKEKKGSFQLSRSEKLPATHLLSQTSGIKINIHEPPLGGLKAEALFIHAVKSDLIAFNEAAVFSARETGRVIFLSNDVFR